MYNVGRVTCRLILTYSKQYLVFCTENRLTMFSDRVWFVHGFEEEVCVQKQAAIQTEDGKQALLVVCFYVTALKITPLVEWASRTFETNIDRPPPTWLTCPNIEWISTIGVLPMTKWNKVSNNDIIYSLWKKNLEFILHTYEETTTMTASLAEEL